MKSTNTIGIRKRGILACFHEFKSLYGRYPETPEDLSKVTSTILQQNNFEKYQKWYFEFTGEREIK